MPRKNVDKSQMPRIGQEHISEENLCIIYVASIKYEYNERPLTRDEVTGILSELESIPVDDSRKVMKDLFNTLQNPLAKFSGESNDLFNKDQPRYFERVNSLFLEMCAKDQEAEARRVTLEGLKVRLPYLPWGKPVSANWGNSEVRPDQYGRLYALIHWCKDVDHQALNEVDIKDIATSRIFSGKVTRGNAIIGGLQDVDDERSKLVNRMLTCHPNITTFFARIAFGYHKDFLKQQATRTNQAFQEPPYYEPPSAQDSLETTTSAMAALTVTAGPSTQRGRSNPPESTPDIINEHPPTETTSAVAGLTAIAGPSHRSGLTTPHEGSPDIFDLFTNLNSMNSGGESPSQNERRQRRVREESTPDSAPSPEGKGKGKAPQGKRPRRE